MNRGLKDALFFKKWGAARQRYFTKKAALAILAYSSSLLVVLFSLDIVIYPYLLISFILIASLGIIFIAIYIVISNPPTKLNHQPTSIDETEE